MKICRMVLTSVLALWLLGLPGMAAEKKGKLTCCQEAAAKKEECKHKCCLNAHRAGKSCEKCNPGKEDLKLDKKK